MAVTGKQPLTAGQAARCKAAVLQIVLPEKCSEGPSGYVIDLMGDDRAFAEKLPMSGQFASATDLSWFEVIKPCRS